MRPLSYRQRVREIEIRLGHRHLVYFGTRGTDARPLLELSQLDEVFSQIAPLGGVNIRETCLEALKKERVDLNRYSIDKDPHPTVAEIHAGLLRSFARPSAVVPYRPSAVLASAWFPRADRVLYLGVFHEKQACFEHKPWVETQLAEAGVRVLPWQYYSDDDKILIYEAAEAGPIVLRANRSDGGAGLELIRHPVELNEKWPAHHDGFLAAAPFLEGSVPLNVNACVFRGEVVLHPPSLQLIGLAECTGRAFGYCGNDFARIAELDGATLDALDGVTRTAGRWLASQGYLGAFGIDALVDDGKVYLVEINPRFQGSSVLAADLMRELDVPDLFLDHVAAFLDLSPPHKLTLRDLVARQSPAAHVICYNRTAGPRRADALLPDSLALECSLSPAADIAVQPEGVLFDLRFHQAVTEGGMELSGAAQEQIEQARRSLYPGEELSLAVG